jgi:hypothetical protein
MSSLSNALSVGQVYWPSQSDITDAKKICFCTSNKHFSSFADKTRYIRAQLAGCCCTSSQLANLYVPPPACGPPGPIIDFEKTTAKMVHSGIAQITITWLPVAAATSYKVFYRLKHASVILSPQNQPGRSYTTPLFTNDSGPLTVTTFTTNLSAGFAYNFYVFHYINGIRGELPATQLYITSDPLPNVIQLWPTITIKPTGLLFTDPITCTNVYNQESVIVSPAEQLTNAFPNLPTIHATAPIQTKTF